MSDAAQAGDAFCVETASLLAFWWGVTDTSFAMSCRALALSPSSVVHYQQASSPAPGRL